MNYGDNLSVCLSTGLRIWYNGVLLSHAKEGNPMATCTDWEGIMLNYMSDRERQILCDVTYM